MAKFFKGFFTQGERVLRDETQSCKLTLEGSKTKERKKKIRNTLRVSSLETLCLVFLAATFSSCFFVGLSDFSFVFCN